MQRAAPARPLAGFPPRPASRTHTLPLQCTPKPEDDPYSFTQFAHTLNSCEGVNPLPSDSRRRPDRAALELGKSGGERFARPRPGRPRHPQPP